MLVSKLISALRYDGISLAPAKKLSDNHGKLYVHGKYGVLYSVFIRGDHTVVTLFF